MTTWERATAGGGAVLVLALLSFGGSGPAAAGPAPAATNAVEPSAQPPGCAAPGTADTGEPHPTQSRGAMRAV